ncbi:MAG TPA: hypothetical protein VI032_04450 [Burkholderiaceae bacterium]
MNTAHTHRTLSRIAALAFAATVASVAQAGPPVMQGELVFTEPVMPTTPSTVSRDAVKAATRAANIDGGLGNNGQATYRPFYYATRDGVPAYTASTKTRADRKAETVHAIKSQQMLHAGEVI